MMAGPGETRGEDATFNMVKDMNTASENQIRFYLNMGGVSNYRHLPKYGLTCLFEFKVPFIVFGSTWISVIYGEFADAEVLPRSPGRVSMVIPSAVVGPATGKVEDENDEAFKFLSLNVRNTATTQGFVVSARRFFEENLGDEDPAVFEHCVADFKARLDLELSIRGFK